ncbi:MAG: tyramine oxidase subunit B [Treponema sp.]|nr:tyramine oxidase subunit B [Treponema sp.]
MGYPEVNFLYLNEADMIRAGVTDMKSCIDTIEEMFKLMKKGNYVMGGANHNSHGVMMSFPEHPAFPEMPHDGPDRRFMAMPAYLGGKFDMAGMKWYGSNVENKNKGLPRSILMLTLNDKDTGAPLAYMSANILSAMRTGAVPGVGFRYFAKKDSKVAGIIGPGVMNKTAFMAIITERPGIDTVKIKGHTPESKSTTAFVEWLKTEYPQVTHVEVVESEEAAVRDADIVSIATSSPTGNPSEYPYVKEEWIKPGAVFSCPSSALFDDDFILHRARTITDNIKLYEAWESEMPFPAYNTIPIPAVHCMDLIAEKKMTNDQVDDLGDILTGKIPARRKEDEIIIYSVGGMPVEDVAWGTTVYRRALELGVGTKLNLWNTPALA